MRSPAPPGYLPAPLETSLALVHEWLVKVADAGNLELDLRNLRTVLINLLEMVEERPSITAAADRVYDAALVYEREVKRAGTTAYYDLVLRRAAAMEEALAGLRRALGKAKPSAFCSRQVLW